MPVLEIEGGAIKKLNVKKVDHRNFTQLHLSGVINEKTELKNAFEETRNEIHIYCREIQAISSVGAKLCSQFFKELDKKGKKLWFYECSPAMIEQVNVIPSFIPRAQIQSICVPFICKRCGAELEKPYPVDEAMMTRFKGLVTKCDACGADSAEFDEFEEEYFSFLHEGRT